jgi:hypothetical protein
VGKRRCPAEQQRCRSSKVSACPHRGASAGCNRLAGPRRCRRRPMSRTSCRSPDLPPVLAVLRAGRSCRGKLTLEAREQSAAEKPGAGSCGRRRRLDRRHGPAPPRRHGPVVRGIRALSTLGTILRSFTSRRVRQLDSVAAAGPCGPVPTNYWRSPPSPSVEPARVAGGVFRPRSDGRCPHRTARLVTRPAEWQVPSRAPCVGALAPGSTAFRSADGRRDPLKTTCRAASPHGRTAANMGADASVRSSGSRKPSQVRRGRRDEGDEARPGCGVGSVHLVRPTDHDGRHHRDLVESDGDLLGRVTAAAVSVKAAGSNSATRA